MQARLDLFYYCFPASSSCFYLSLTRRGLSECYSLLPLSPSHLLPPPLLCPTVTRSPVSSLTGRSAEGGREGGSEAGCSGREDARHMWIVTQQSYIIRPFFSSMLTPPNPQTPQLSTSQTQQLTHRHAPQQQMGIPGLDGPTRPYWEGVGGRRIDQKLKPVL